MSDGEEGISWSYLIAAENETAHTTVAREMHSTTQKEDFDGR
jgi:hypothetical protein